MSTTPPFAAAPPRIGTHNGFFHADDVLAVATLLLLYPDAQVIRTRDEAELARCDFLVDVGGIYDATANRFDHHFPDGPAYHDGLLMSSFGLVWAKFGETLTGSAEIADILTYQLVRPIDAADNGVTIHCRSRGAPDVPMLSLSSVIAVMNPPETELADATFTQVVTLGQTIIRQFISNAQQRIKAREFVHHAFEYAVRKNARHLELPEAIKWEEALHALDPDSRILYVIYPQNHQWYLRCVSRKPNSYTPRRKLPTDWVGLREAAFSTATGVKDGVFCHHAGFVCATRSRQSILELVRKALDYKG